MSIPTFPLVFIVILWYGQLNLLDLKMVNEKNEKTSKSYDMKCSSTCAEKSFYRGQELTTAWCAAQKQHLTKADSLLLEGLFLLTIYSISCLQHCFLSLVECIFFVAYALIVSPCPWWRPTCSAPCSPATSECVRRGYWRWCSSSGSSPRPRWLRANPGASPLQVRLTCAHTHTQRQRQAGENIRPLIIDSADTYRDHSGGAAILGCETWRCIKVVKREITLNGILFSGGFFFSVVSKVCLVLTSGGETGYDSCGRSDAAA